MKKIKNIFPLIFVITVFIVSIALKPKKKLSEKYKRDIEYSSESLYGLGDDILIKEIILYECEDDTYVYTIYKYIAYKTKEIEENYQVFSTRTGKYLSGGIVESLNKDFYRKFSEDRLKAKRTEKLSEDYIKYLNTEVKSKYLSWNQYNSLWILFLKWVIQNGY
ncbi:Uncharacterised protein [Haploplasma axanthum]|uniref:Uncharacterized protein n=2 Tax=Haploplasma axanthum TaxID=29552 RepID=A0A449BCJ5_HAPAX|nr:Uncharacterised protein [Haploplasma axanthum]